MDIEEVREIGLSLPHTTERCPFGPDALALEIGGRMFCLLDLSGKWTFYNIKVHPDYSIELQERHTSIRPGFHMNKKHWISVDFNGNIPKAMHRKLIEHAYLQTRKALPRKQREIISTTSGHKDNGN